MFMCVVHQKSVNKLDLNWKQSFLINWPMILSLTALAENAKIKSSKTTQMQTTAFPRSDKASITTTQENLGGPQN
jgi:hypothetical protein